MPAERGEELPIRRGPELQRLVLRRGNQLFAVGREANRSNRRAVRFEHLRGVQADGAGCPQPYGSVLGAAGDALALRGVRHGQHRVLVPGEAVRAHAGLEVPDHERVVAARGDELFHVGVERARRDAVPVPPERALERGVLAVEGLVRHGDAPESNHGRRRGTWRRRDGGPRRESVSGRVDARAVDAAAQLTTRARARVPTSVGARVRTRTPL
mmetsp:Transcript_4649/g.18598  ORF Transcript_4649/g.18598 Transcript_4649/m.18598 type:complete len:213 (+) Transcript_4649:629-1267(+)